MAPVLKCISTCLDAVLKAKMSYTLDERLLAQAKIQCLIVSHYLWRYSILPGLSKAKAWLFLLTMVLLKCFITEFFKIKSKQSDEHKVSSFFEPWLIMLIKSFLSHVILTLRTIIFQGYPLYAIVLPWVCRLRKLQLYNLLGNLGIILTFPQISWVRSTMTLNYLHFFSLQIPGPCGYWIKLLFNPLHTAWWPLTTSLIMFLHKVKLSRYPTCKLALNWDS